MGGAASIVAMRAYVARLAPMQRAVLSCALDQHERDAGIVPLFPIRPPSEGWTPVPIGARPTKEMLSGHHLLVGAASTHGYLVNDTRPDTYDRLVAAKWCVRARSAKHAPKRKARAEEDADEDEVEVVGTRTSEERDEEGKRNAIPLDDDTDDEENVPLSERPRRARPNA